MQPTAPETILTAGPTWALRAELRDLLGLRAVRNPLRARSVARWGAGRPRLDALHRRPVLSVRPGPLLSPYDDPAHGLASLRLCWLSGGGRPLPRGSDDPATVAETLRRLRLHGRNEALRAVPPAFGEALAGEPPVLALADGDAPWATARRRAFAAQVRAREPGRRILLCVPGYQALLVPGTPPLAPEARVDPWALFPLVGRIWAADVASACEPLIAGLAVCLLDAATPDRDDAIARKYGEGVAYLDPWTRRPTSFAEAAERVAWLRDRHAANDRPTVLVGISRWKRPGLDALVRGPHGAPAHAMAGPAAIALARPNRARVAAWATRMPAALPALCEAAGLPLSRIEDGFLRSVGLGASFQPGASIVLDERGIYYDPRQESGLAHILATTAFSADLVARAAALREAVVARRLSKYNVGLAADEAASWPRDRRIVLVPGQVEDDASVLHGSPVVRANRALLAAARERHPDAFVLYKPHPDVEAGFRPGRIAADEIAALADGVVGGLSIVELLDRVDHVETMTSLAGFEALIRGRSVGVHGRPFYAGWGLTEDLAPGADRGRRLALDELVAGAMILYPRYLDPVAMKPCTPEHLLDRLSEARDAAAPSALALSPLAWATVRARYAVLNPLARALRRQRGVDRGNAPRQAP